jgi:CBS domain-containing protein
MKSVSDLLKNHTLTVWNVGPDDSVFDALQVLAEHDVGALTVMEHEKLVGILSERDYTRKVALLGKDSKDTKVADIMTRDVMVVTPQSRTRDCMALMRLKRIRHLPVLDGDTVVGMISIRDILDDVIADHELTIAQLQSYIYS